MPGSSTQVPDQAPDAGRVLTSHRAFKTVFVGAAAPVLLALQSRASTGRMPHHSLDTFASITEPGKRYTKVVHLCYVDHLTRQHKQEMRQWCMACGRVMWVHCRRE